MYFYDQIWSRKMYRENIKNLINWKIGEHRKPLIVLGARQVGKTSAENHS